MEKLILASGSARRIDLLRKVGLNPIIVEPNVEENLPSGISPKDAVSFLAFKKALYVEEEVRTAYPGYTVLAADTVVALGDRIMGKPKDKEDALEILMSLSGRVHKVYTGVALLKIGEPVRTVFVDETKVYFKSYTPEDLEAYLNTPEPYDKAGAYAIQGYFAKFVDKYEGSYNNVMGLPTSRIIPLLYSSTFGF